MFEVNVFNPEQFGTFVAWLVIRRGPLSALVHPNTGDDERDHTQVSSVLGLKWSRKGLMENSWLCGWGRKYLWT